MALRQAPNAVVIGSPSIGADGNVANMVFPGAVHTSMTSLGVYDTGYVADTEGGADSGYLCGTHHPGNPGRP